ncbi:MAG: cytochrome c, partial [Rhodospirillaceae bacterium]|nr:cytochrome c [Rhodospirillaceae bacterium]
YSVSSAAETRCMLHDGSKVECPVRTEAELAAASKAYDEEAAKMSAGTAGSTYGVAPFDYLTGNGKKYDTTGKKAISEMNKGVSGYGGKGGKTELWDRVKKPTKGEAIYNQWTNNWSPSFKSTLVSGADPNEGKQWYYVYCITCHGWGLKGNGPSAEQIDPRPRILTAGSYMNKKSNLQLFEVIKGGGEAVSLSSSMPSWGNYLQDQDIWNLVAWIRAMADADPKTLTEYLNPKSTYKPLPGEVNAMNAAKSDAFQDSQELLELSVAGRAESGALMGGGYVEGGLRKKAADVEKKVNKGY